MSLLSSRPHLGGGRYRAEILSEPVPVQAVSQLWDASRQSDRRGVIYWFSANPRRSLDSYSHKEIRRKAEKLMANVGLADRIPSGMADLAGSLRAKVTSPDPDWNDEAEAAFEHRAMEPVNFDWSERWDYQSVQWQLNREAFAFGDMLQVRAEGRNAFYEAWQIGHDERKHRPGTWDGDLEWHEGVAANRHGAHRAYQVMAADGSADTPPIPASACYYYAKPKRPGLVRGMSVLAGAINKIQDLTENAGDIMMGIKARNQIGYYLTNGDPRDTMSGRTLADRALTDVRAVRYNADGELEEVQVRLEDVLAQGGTIPNLPPGMDIATLQHNQPGQNEVAFWAFLIRDICWFTGIPPEVLWDMAGLHGANVRWISEVAQRWIDQHHRTLQGPWLRWLMRRELASLIELGELRPGPTNWWRHLGYLAPARWTVDRGREGGLAISEFQVGLRSRASHFGEMGTDWKDETRQIVQEQAWIDRVARQHGVDPARVGGVLPGQAALPMGYGPPAEEEQPIPAEEEMTV